MRPGPIRPPSGDPIPCGICGLAVVGGLRIGGRPANQGMRHEGLGYVHGDREVCKVLLKNKERLEDSVRIKAAGATVPEDADRGTADVEGSDLLHLPGEVGLDSGYDEPAGA